MSCAQIALKQLGIPVEKYYSSEIDKFAIKQTQLNFPGTILLGDVNNWKSWNIHWSSIDLVCAGSPCQGFSFAGKQLAFDDPRSKLFFVFVEILNHCKKFNPEVKFLLENVDMKKDHLRIISEYVGIFPTKINSALVSAQNRERWYWSNIRTKQIGLFDELYTDIPQPEDRGLFQEHILQPENEVDKKYHLSKTMMKWLNNHSAKNAHKGYGSGLKVKGPGEKMSCLTSGQYKQNLSSDYVCTNVKQLSTSIESGGKQPYQQNRIYDISGKSPALMAGLSSGSNAVFIPKTDSIRRLTPIECSRLQTIPDWYKWECSDSQIYRMLGNGWTVEVIMWIFGFMDNIS